jgi:hypothetical protein
VRLDDANAIVEDRSPVTVPKPRTVRHDGVGTKATIGPYRVVAYDAGEWGGVLQFENQQGEIRRIEEGRFVGLMAQGPEGLALRTGSGAHASEILRLEADADAVRIASKTSLEGYSYVLVGNVDDAWIVGDLGLWRYERGKDPVLVHRAKWPFVQSAVMTPTGEVVLATRWSVIKVSTADPAFPETWWVPPDCR